MRKKRAAYRPKGVSKLFCLLSSVALFLPFGCASYEAASDLAAVNQELPQKQLQVDSHGLELRVVVLSDPDIAKKYVGIDPRQSGMVPLLLKVCNNNDRIVRLDLAKSKLFTGSGEAFPSLSVDDSIERARISNDQVAGWYLAFGLFGGIASGARVDAANQSLDVDYRKKTFKPTLIMGRGTGEGLVFFDVPGDKQVGPKRLVLTASDVDRGEAADIDLNLE